MKILIIFFNAFSSCLMYSFMHQHFISWFNNDFNICSFKILMNFSSFIIFQLQRDFHADFLQTLKSIIVCINKWFEKFFIFSLISHHINWFIILSVVKIKFIVIWDSWYSFVIVSWNNASDALMFVIILINLFNNKCYLE